MSSLNNMSFNDADSNIDLDAMESDMESYNSSENSTNDSSDDSVRHQTRHQQNIPNLPTFVPSHNEASRNTYSDSAKSDEVPSWNPPRLAVNKVSTVDSIDSYARYNSGRNNSALPSIRVENSNTDNLTNTYTTESFSGDEDEQYARTKDLFSDSYSYDYMSNVKSKPGDKLKTSWANTMQNERQYKDLQIINEVSKLQNLNFFSSEYTKSLDTLKISQLSLLTDMVKLSESSFDEFFKIWETIETNDNTTKEEIAPPTIKAESKIPQSTSLRNSFNDTVFTVDMENQEKRGKDKVFDINNNEGFKLMEQRKNDILSDLEKINNSIDQIDSFTKSMWSNI